MRNQTTIYEGIPLAFSSSIYQIIWQTFSLEPTIIIPI